MKSLLLILALMVVTTISFSQKFDSRKAIERGVKLHDNQQFEDAAKEFLKVPITDTNYLLAQYELALTYGKDSTAYDKALEVIAAAKKIPFNNYELSLTMIEGSVLDHSNRRKEAHAVYDEVLKKFPEYPQAYYEKAIVYFQDEDYTNAIKFFKQSLIRNPYHFRSHYLLGNSYYKQGRVAEAMIATHFAMMATSDKGQSQLAVGQLSFLSKGSDTLINRSKAMEAEYKDASFDEITEVLLSRVSMDKKYQLKTDVDDEITRQLQVVYELADYKPSNDKFVNQYYIPFMQKVWKEERFNEFMLYLFSDLGLKFIDKKVKKNKKGIGKVNEEIQQYFTKMSATRELNYQIRNSMDNKYLASGQELIIASNKLDKSGNEDKYVYTGPYQYYNYGVLRSEGNYNSEHEKDGLFKYYNSLGILIEEENYKNGKLAGWEKLYNSYGLLKAEIFYNDKEIPTKRKQYDDGVLYYEVALTDKDAPLDYIFYHSNGKVNYRYKEKDGDPIDGDIVYYYNNGKQSSKLNFKNKKRQGLVNRFYKNGARGAVENYENGKLTGLCKYYFANGNIKSEYNYDNDELNGPFKLYFLDGKTESEGSYKNGKLHGEFKSYYYTGKLMRTIQYINGLVTGSKYEDAKNAKYNNTPKNKERFFFADGNLASDLKNNKKGILEGRSTYYFYSGKLKEALLYKNGKKEGSSVYYHLCGTKRIERNFKEDELDGYYTTFEIAGDTSQAGYYVKDKAHGTWKDYTEGVLTEVNQYSKGALDGPTLFYHQEDKSMYKSKWYQEGLLTGMIEYDKNGKVTHSTSFPGGNGVYTTHYRNGNVDFTSPLKNGKFNGVSEKKYFDGKLRQTAEYKNGNFIGERKINYYNGRISDYYRYNVDGDLKLYENHSISGFLDRRITYTDTPDYYVSEYFIANKPYLKSTTQEDEINGREIYYGPNKEIAGVLNYVSGRIVSYSYKDKTGNFVDPISLNGGKGSVVMYYKSGQKSLEFTLKDGYHDGDFKYFYPNGKIGKSRTYKNQLIVGTSKEFAENGQELSSVHYNAKGNLDGLYVLNDATGKSYFKVNYKNGIATGVGEMLNVTSGKMMQLTFENNIIVHVK